MRAKETKSVLGRQQKSLGMTIKYIIRLTMYSVSRMPLSMMYKIYLQGILEN
jgi:hypothetical protein